MQTLKHIGTPGQIRATEALLKFCRDHGHTSGWIVQLEEVVVALREKDVLRLRQKVELFRRAGMGSFHDWFPPAIAPYETEDYAETVWWALYAHWREALKPVTKDTEST